MCAGSVTMTLGEHWNVTLICGGMWSVTNVCGIVSDSVIYIIIVSLSVHRHTCNTMQPKQYIIVVKECRLCYRGNDSVLRQ